MPSPFELASAVTPIAPDRYLATIPDGWQQGRGAFGGLVIATMLRTIERHEPDRARVPRTVIADIAGPVEPGDVELAVHVVRRGARQSNVRVELIQNGEVAAFASAVLSGPRPTGVDARPRAPSVPPARDVAILPMGAPRGPAFTQHYEYRPIGGGPHAVRAEPTVAGWVREAVAPSALDAPALVALLDSFWPAFFSTTTSHRPVATVSFTAEVLCDPRALDPRAPLFYQARTVCDHQGFQLETRELYDASGDVVAMNQQTFVVIK